MAYKRARFDLDAGTNAASETNPLELKNLGLSIYVFGQGEGFDFFHNHREQEEVYMCLEGTATLKLGGEHPETLTLEKGDAVRVDPATLRAFGNESSARAVVLIAGACPHPYPAGIGGHDVIADVLNVTGKGEVGFTTPPGIERTSAGDDMDDC